MADWLKANVEEKTQWNERLFSLHMQPGLDDFIASQFARVGLDIDGERIARPYSLVNKPGDNSLEIYFNIVPEGPLSSRLAALEAGDDIYVTEKAYGFLTIDEVPDSRDLWLLATGSGVGPFLSILKRSSHGSVLKKSCWHILYDQFRTELSAAYLRAATAASATVCLCAICYPGGNDRRQTAAHSSEYRRWLAGAANRADY